MTMAAAGLSCRGDNIGEFRAAIAARIEAHSDAIELLVALLDLLDGDPDLEDDGTGESWLGWTAGMGLGNTLDLDEEGAYEGQTG